MHSFHTVNHPMSANWLILMVIVTLLATIEKWCVYGLLLWLLDCAQRLLQRRIRGVEFVAGHLLLVLYFATFVAAGVWWYTGGRPSVVPQTDLAALEQSPDRKPPLAVAAPLPANHRPPQVDARPNPPPVRSAPAPVADARLVSKPSIIPADEFCMSLPASPSVSDLRINLPQSPPPQPVSGARVVRVRLVDSTDRMPIASAVFRVQGLHASSSEDGAAALELPTLPSLSAPVLSLFQHDDFVTMVRLATSSDLGRIEMVPKHRIMIAEYGAFRREESLSAIRPMLTDVLEQRFAREGESTLVRGQGHETIVDTLVENGRTRDIHDPSKLKLLGKLNGATRVVLWSVTRLDKQVELTLQLADLASGQTLISVRGSAVGPDELPNQAGVLADEILARFFCRATVLCPFENAPCGDVFDLQGQLNFMPAEWRIVITVQAGGLGQHYKQTEVTVGSDGCFTAQAIHLGEGGQPNTDQKFKLNVYVLSPEKYAHVLGASDPTGLLNGLSPKEGKLAAWTYVVLAANP